MYVDYVRVYILFSISLQSSESPQALAETVATITNDFMSFEPSDVSVTATLIGSLTQDAVQDPEVCFILTTPISKLSPCPQLHAFKGGREELHANDVSFSSN